MTIAPLPPGTQTFYGPNSQFLAGGSVFTYIPRTTAVKGTWADSGQASQNTNPVVLSSLGQGVMFGWGAIRQRVLDSNGQTIWDSPTWGGGLVQTTVVLNIPGGGLWTPPPGITRIYAEVVGGGGAGSNCLAGSATEDVAGGGGGAGGFANGIYNIAAGVAIPYYVATGAAIGSQGPGGITNLGNLLDGNGGIGSSFASGGTSVGGTGGTAGGGTIFNLPGGSGTDGSHIPPSGGAPYIGPGNGGESFYGYGGTFVNGNDGNSGVAPGSGGGGAGDVNLQNITFSGGAGANGQILISYWG